MVFRKPYAFLIKNFKKIHIVLLMLSLFVAFKTLDVYRFITDFMRFNSYDFYRDPITSHITFWVRLSIVLLAIGSASILLLLHHKNKPWKLYLIPVIQYLAMFFVLGMITSFFSSYSSKVETTDLRLSKDLLMMLLGSQLVSIGIYIIRVIGLDIRKFNFNLDEEFLSLSEDDREEFEININIDKNSFKRAFRRTIRNIQYFYKEHKKICQSILIIILLYTGFQTYKLFFVTHKTYSEGNDYGVNGYTIQVHNSYFTDKDYTGNVISTDSNFVIVDLTVTNHEATRKLKVDNFHLKNGVDDYITTNKIYAKEFQDFGKVYENSKELRRDESFRFIIVYKVSKELNKKNFNLYYQEYDYLRKIKLKIKDYSEIKDVLVINFGDDMTFSLQGEEENISFDYCEFLDSLTYYSRPCNSVKCSINEYSYTAPEGFTVMKIDFASIKFVGKDMVDFSSDYGKIVYVDNSNGDEEEAEIEFQYPFSRVATGKSIYTLVPKEVEASNSVKLVYVVRNKEYVYKLI